MYTVDEEKKDVYDEFYDDELDEAVAYQNRKSIIFKIIIIILCVIILIWLISALTKNKNTDNGKIHNDNVTKVRLAAEKYFFINGNTDKSSVNLYTLKSNGLVNDVIDANNKVCNDNKTNVKISKDEASYKMVVGLSCSTNDKEEIFYYHGNTLACLNCNGQTNMDGKTVVVANPTPTPEPTPVYDDNGGNTYDDNNISNDNDLYSQYSCFNWSDWSKDRIIDNYLTERSKTLVLGVKKGDTVSKTVYGEWSDYTTTPLYASDTLEVDTKVETSSAWSGNKTSTSPVTETATLKLISTSGEKKVLTGNLTVTDYLSGKYEILNDRCENVQTLRNSDGKYVLTYVNCQYTEKDSNDSEGTVYTYQELETVSTTYYRSRTITVINENGEDIYTKEKYEESELPAGYTKVDGSEETYYSYKIAYCEK